MLLVKAHKITSVKFFNLKSAVYISQSKKSFVEVEAGLSVSICLSISFIVFSYAQHTPFIEDITLFGIL